MIRLLFLVAMFAGFSGYSAAQSNDTLVKLNTKNVGAAFTESGMLYSEETDSDGDPKITVKIPPGMRGESINVLFYDCNERGDCEDITIWGWFKTPEKVEIPTINEFNKTTRWTRAYIDDDGDPILEMDLNATGGIGDRAVEILVATFLDRMRSLGETIDSTRADVAATTDARRRSEKLVDPGNIQG